VESVLRDHRIDLNDVVAIATRARFVGDQRLNLGPPVIGYPDALLEEKSAPCERATGIRARVAETAALLASGSERPSHAPPVARSAHATVAIVPANPEY
jgi:hypothetical protein